MDSESTDSPPIAPASDAAAYIESLERTIAALSIEIARMRYALEHLSAVPEAAPGAPLEQLLEEDESEPFDQVGRVNR